VPSDNQLRIGGPGEILGLGIPNHEKKVVPFAGVSLIAGRTWRDEVISVETAGHFDPWSFTKFLSWFVPSGAETLKWAVMIISVSDFALASTVDFVAQRPFHYGEEPIDSWKAEFRGRVFLYHNSGIASEDQKSLIEAAEQRGLKLQLRGPAYATEREKKEVPVAFISHDSRDKQEIALKLATALRSRGCAVWYDDFSLKVGDSLRQSIEAGIKAAHRCILVITPNFLSNTGWTKVEFNSIFTREILERRNVILPIWHGVSQKDVYDYSPSLAERVALQWSIGQDEVATRLTAVLLERKS
jgi:hypothetical protein